MNARVQSSAVLQPALNYREFSKRELKHRATEGGFA